MLYTVIASQCIWKDETIHPKDTLQRMQWGDTQIFIDDKGVVNAVLSSDPAVFLRMNAHCPCGRIR